MRDVGPVCISINLVSVGTITAVSGLNVTALSLALYKYVDYSFSFVLS